MTRSEDGANALTEIGADVHRGDLEDLESLKKGTKDAEAVIHLAFNHDFSKFAENCEQDKRVIEALGSVLTGSDRPLIVHSGLAGLTEAGQKATEDMTRPKDSPFPRKSEETALSLNGVKAAAIRLSQVHNTVKQGLITNAIKIARDKGVSAYIGDGMNKWAAVHVSDAARLFRLALEKFEAGSVYHAVAEEAIPMRDIAEAIGRSLDVPVTSIAPEEAEEHFGWFIKFAGNDLMASSTITQEKLGWTPTGPSLIEDLKHMRSV